MYLVGRNISLKNWEIKWRDVIKEVTEGERIQCV